MLRGRSKSDATDQAPKTSHFNQTLRLAEESIPDAVESFAIVVGFASAKIQSSRRTPIVNPNTPQAKTISFGELWKNYPNDDPCVNPRTHNKAYDDQCAIRVGMALEKSGVNFASFKGPVCQYGPRGNGMVLRAQDLANWLWKKPFIGCPAVMVIQPGNGFAQRVKARTGIIFFEHYWLRSGEKLNANPKAPYGTGNHIDLWNKDRLTPSFHDFMRFSLHINHFPSLNPFAPVGQNWYSDLNHSERILFWQIS